MRLIILILFFSSITKLATAQESVEILLYAKEIPNATKNNTKEKTILVNGTRRIYDVIAPTLTIFTPAKPLGIAIIICPGGGYSRLSIDNEGIAVGKALSKIGITAFVLKYRLPNDTIMVDKSLGPLQDIQQAVRLVRKLASKYGVNEKSIGVMGFSAGGHVASSAITHFNFTADSKEIDTTSVRPDFAVLIYPVISFDSSIMHKGSRDHLIGEKPLQKTVDFYSNELQVTPQTPPVFIVHAGDDGTVPVENSIRFYKACIKNKVPSEMHLYPKGGHGFGMNNKTTNDKWLERLQNWLPTVLK